MQMNHRTAFGFDIVIATAIVILVTGCQSHPRVTAEPGLAAVAAVGGIDHVEIRRLLPGDDVRLSLEAWAKQNSVKAASILSAVGSLKKASIRFADRNDVSVMSGPFEVVALSGLVAESGAHLHLAVSDGTGKTSGGHLAEGSIVYTTLELVIGVYGGIHDGANGNTYGKPEFRRDVDPRTGYKELFLSTH